MKIERIVLAVIMLGLCGFGWYNQISAIQERRVRYDEFVEAALDFENRGLHQKAIQSYNDALAIEEDIELRRGLMAVCMRGYEDGAVSRKAYQQELERFTALYPTESDSWEKLVALLCEANDYRGAKKALERAARGEAESEKLHELSIKVHYSYNRRGKTFTKFFASPEGFLTGYDGRGWGVLKPDGEEEYACDYLYISPYNEGRTALYCDEESSRLVDADEIVQALLPDGIQEARAYGSGVLPVKCGEKWKFYDCEENRYLSDSYEDASSYQNETAAIRKETEWSLIDLSGKANAKERFADIKLYGNGVYSFKGYFAGKTASGWSLYQTGTMEQVLPFVSDLDLYMGGLLAYQDATGLWGYMDLEGNVVIEPAYQGARSFSGNLAAVFNGSQWGFINQDNELVIDYQFEDVGYFTTKGACLVSEVEDQYHIITLRFPEG